MKLKWYYVAWAVFAIIICSFMAIGMGTTFYATITNEPSARGNIYQSYGISRQLYAIYAIVVAAIAAVLAIFHVKALRTNNQKLMVRIVIWFFIFALAHLSFEFLMLTRHAPKA